MKCNEMQWKEGKMGKAMTIRSSKLRLSSQVNGSRLKSGLKRKNKKGEKRTEVKSRWSLHNRIWYYDVK